MEVAAVLWDYYKPKKSNLYPILIRITANNKPPDYVKTGYKVGKGQWTGSRVHESHPKHAEINKRIRDMIKGVEDDFVTGTSPELLAEHAKSLGDFYYYFQKDIDAARDRGSHHRADTNTSMLNVFKAWRQTWPVKDVTVDALKSLVRFLQARGNSKNTISDKLVRIRTTVENMGKLIEESPFKNFPISFDPTDPTALSDEDISLLRQAKFPRRHKRAPVARDLWLFAMNAAGMRWGDLCRLKVSNVAGGRIHYRMNKSREIVDIPQTEEAAAIIKRYAKNKAPEDYLFPILSGRYVTEGAIAKRIKNANRAYNRSLGYIARKQKMKDRPKLHDARHTFADLVDDVHAAQKLLKHKKITTTQIYKTRIRGGTDDVLLNALKNKKR